MANSELDLSQLALNREPAGAAAKRPPRRRWLTRYALPVGILCGFAALIVAAAGKQILPKTVVTTVPVIVKRSEIQQAGTELFQAAGWIEPRPTSIRVAALAPGVIEELLVVEGQKVAKGEPIAKLVTIDAELAVEQAEAALALQQSELERAIAERDAAVVRLEKPVHLQSELAEAKSRLAAAKTQRGKLPYLIAGAEAALKYAKENYEGKRSAQAAITERLVQQSAREYAEAQSARDELKARGPNLDNEITALQETVDALQSRWTY